MLALASGQSSTATCAMHGVTDTDIAPWKRRVIEGGMVALGDRPHRGRLDPLAPRVAAKIRAKAQEASQVSRARAAPCRAGSSARCFTSDSARRSRPMRSQSYTVHIITRHGRPPTWCRQHTN